MTFLDINDVSLTRHPNYPEIIQRAVSQTNSSVGLLYYIRFIYISPLLGRGRTDFHRRHSSNGMRYLKWPHNVVHLERFFGWLSR